MSEYGHPLLRSKFSWLGLVLLVQLTVALRCGVMTARWDRLSQDPDAYRLIAENMVRRGVYSRAPAGDIPVPTAYRPPLYPLALAAVSYRGHVAPWGVAALHVVVGTMTVLLVLFLARAWGLGDWSWLAATLVACDPILLNQSAEVMTETLATLMAVIGLLMLSSIEGDPDRVDNLTAGVPWWKTVLTGIALGVAVLCRPTFLIWALLSVAYLAITAWLPQRNRWQGVRSAALLSGGVLIVLMPWVVRNWLAVGKPVFATTHGGYTLLLANNPPFYDHLQHDTGAEVWEADELQAWLAGLPPAEPLPRAEHREVTEDRRLYGLAVQTMEGNPRMFAYSCLVRVGRLWNPLPHRLSSSESYGNQVLRWGVAVWYSGMFLLAGLGVWHFRGRLWRTPWIWGGLCLLAFTVVHSVYWSNMRMRAPLMPPVYLAVAAACGGIRSRSKCDKS